MAERMATVGRLSLRVAARGAQPHRRHRAQRRAARGHRARSAPGRTWRRRRAGQRDPRSGHDARRADRGVPGVRALSRPHFEEESVNDIVRASWRSSCVRSPPARGSTVNVANDPAAPMMEIDRAAPAPGGAESPQERDRGALAAAARSRSASRCDGEAVEISVSDTGGRHPAEVAGRAVRAVLHHQAAGDGARPVHHAADRRGARRRDPLDAARPGAGATFTIRAAVRKRTRA